MINSEFIDMELSLELAFNAFQKYVPYYTNAGLSYEQNRKFFQETFGKAHDRQTEQTTLLEAIGWKRNPETGLWKVMVPRDIAKWWAAGDKAIASLEAKIALNSLEKSEKFWLIGESNSGNTYYYKGYYDRDKPIFSMAIVESLHIASYSSAKEIFDFLNKNFPCEIWLVDQNNVSKIL